MLDEHGTIGFRRAAEIARRARRQEGIDRVHPHGLRPSLSRRPRSHGIGAVVAPSSAGRSGCSERRRGDPAFRGSRSATVPSCWSMPARSGWKASSPSSGTALSIRPHRRLAEDQMHSERELHDRRLRSLGVGARRDRQPAACRRSADTTGSMSARSAPASTPRMPASLRTTLDKLRTKTPSVPLKGQEPGLRAADTDRRDRIPRLDR